MIFWAVGGFLDCEDGDFAFLFHLKVEFGSEIILEVVAG